MRITEYMRDPLGFLIRPFGGDPSVRYPSNAPMDAAERLRAARDDAHDREKEARQATHDRPM